MTRRRWALTLAAIGAALAAVSIIGYLGNRPNAGSAASVETALATRTTTTTTVAPADPEPNPPAWTANETSDLSELLATQRPIPTNLRIESIGIDAPIGAYGVDDGGLMDVPENVTEAGWYKYGPRPGDSGSAVLAAHVDLTGSGPGLFYDLDRLAVGDRITVSYSDGSNQEFRVDARATYLKEDLPLDAIFSRTGPPTLTLVTCGGAFSRSSRSYDSNVVVYASPTPGADESHQGE